MPSLPRLRAESQLLGAERATDTAAVVARLGALQAQDLSATTLAVRARSTGLTADEVDLEGEGFVRTWLMRGTLHVVAEADAGWMLGLLGPVNRAKGARRRAQLGLDDALCERAVEALPSVLADGPLGRAEVVSGLASLGVTLGPEGQAAPHLLGYAASFGVISLGPELARGKASYRLLEASSALSRDEALAELARRYLRGHQPAEPADFAAWSGLSARDAKAAFASLEPPEPVTEPQPGSVRMVGHFDPYLLGYADKTAAVPAEFVARVRTGGGFVTPTVLVDGSAVATWRLSGAALSVRPFTPLSDAVRAGIQSEVDDITRFLGTPLTLSVSAP
ncbi:winged helix DNA-binding domain-containing protein [Cryptosporangium aurantiacum]|uniref:Winged helix DNA-binding domain-containing protein n=1 Tax=Cryptosporangium aurantiacum TaxID=134849 RepID=A0A1M7QSM9_9ACTN|nr:winged helix DNA-binding domain-containing protein [Cryptosporangium aurantiacum]SHN34335.1 Winged helix DNA-binding domain-containing protein [Cryptosporangium aurantiacum]